MCFAISFTNVLNLLKCAFTSKWLGSNIIWISSYPGDPRYAKQYYLSPFYLYSYVTVAVTTRIKRDETFCHFHCCIYPLGWLSFPLPNNSKTRNTTVTLSMLCTLYASRLTQFSSKAKILGKYRKITANSLLANLKKIRGKNIFY